MHPAECTALIDAWQTKNKRERYRDASIMHVIAMAGGMKKRGGGSFKLEDFAPELKKKSPEEMERAAKAFFIKASMQQNRKKTNGKK
jgi:hypothetical protein